MSAVPWVIELLLGILAVCGALLAAYQLVKES